MGTGIPGVPGPGGYGSVSSDGGGRRRRRKRKSVWRLLWEEIKSGLIFLLFFFLIFIAIEAVPYLLKLPDGDIINYSNANIFGKFDALRDGLRHKRGISEIRFSHDGKTVTLTDEKGTLTDISGEGYGDGDEKEFQSDVDEARRILREWGLD